jgi:hypothetical protein
MSSVKVYTIERPGDNILFCPPDAAVKKERRGFFKPGNQAGFILITP